MLPVQCGQVLIPMQRGLPIPKVQLQLSLDSSYKNGSLSRERICNDAAEGSWEIFSQLLDSTPRGNFGNIGASSTLHRLVEMLCWQLRHWPDSRNSPSVGIFNP